MLERIHTPEELYQHKLGAALKMENTVLDMLDANAKEANDAALEKLFRHHQDETRQQIDNIEQAFRSFGWEPDKTTSLSVEGLDKEAKMEAKMTDDSLVDAVLCMGAAE